MTPDGWAFARPSFPSDACGVYVFCAEVERRQIPLRVGKATKTFRQRLFDGSGSHRQAFLAPHVGDDEYIQEWPNYVSFFSQIEVLAEKRFLINTTVSLLALPIGAIEPVVNRAEKEACRELDPVWEMKNSEGRGIWKKRQWLAREPQLEECVERWIERNGRLNLDIDSVLHRIEEKHGSP